MGKYSGRERFSAREFERIERLVKQGVGVRKIGRLLDRSPSSISRQINNPENRGLVKFHQKWFVGFSSELALASQAANKEGRGRIPKVAKDVELRKYLEESIKKKWSPQMALGYAKKKGINFKESISVKTVYNSIYRRDLDISLFDLALKLRRKPLKERRVRQWKRITGRKIDERPDILDRREFGHWETDTILWGKECSVLVLVERKTRYCKLLKLGAHTSKAVNSQIQTLDIPLRTLTADNGSEFARLSEIHKDTYYTHPYSAWEKGSVENLNSLIRRYLPRATSIEKITQKRLSEVETKINNLPRPILDYATAEELYFINAFLH